MRRSFLYLATCIEVGLALLVIAFSPSAFSEDNTHLDKTFAVDGIAKVAFGPGKSWATAGTTQPDGKIIIAGSINYNGYLEAVALTRINQNGVPDNGFGDSGVVVTKLGINSRSTSVGVMPDGRIVVAGWSLVNTTKEGITLAMYNADGTLDSRFGDRGVITFPIEYSAAYAHSLAIQPDGKIVVGGKITIRTEHRDRLFVRSVPNDYVFLARLNDNGSFDMSFGTNGVVVTDVGDGNVAITGLALQRDGRLIAVGTSQKNPDSTLVLARYNVDGSLDKRFGVEGLANRPMRSGRYSSPTVSILPDDRIFLIGGYTLQDHSWLLLSRLHEDGSPDMDFGETGTITTKTELWRYSNFIALLRPDGKILISGMSVRPPKLGKSQPPFYFSIGIARFLASGDPDNSFGENGMHVVSIGVITDMPAYMTVQGDGRIIIGGHSDNGVAQQAVAIGVVP